MALLPWPFEIITKEVEERIDCQLSPAINVQNLARQKAEAVAKDYLNQWVIGADTVVGLKGMIMGKPKDEKEARLILQDLSGKTHQVYTGVAIICQEKKICHTFYQETQVTMQSLSDKELDEYLATGEPFDKAGAYGIQGYGARYISEIIGDYYNVMGLPVHALYEQLNQLMTQKK